MKKVSLFSIPVTLFLLTAFAVPQNVHPHYPTPPESMDPQAAADQTQPSISRRVDLLQLQREADDLARTAQSIPTDLSSVRKGMLPKDVIQKLKQIEKISKHLRAELTQ